MASPPSFTSDELTQSVRRIRRRRGRAGLGGAVSMAVVAAAIAVPLTRGPEHNPVLGPTGLPFVGAGPSYVVTANGQTLVRSATGGTVPQFTVVPGRRVTIGVKVIVPKSHQVKALSLGIVNSVLNGHLNPLLAASTRAPLGPGAHRFVLRWNVPAGLRPGATRQLSAKWAFSGMDSGDAQEFVADFAVALPPGATSGPVAARRLRALALRAVASCNGEAPTSIQAVRTTFAKATAAVGSSSGEAVKATQAVYLVLVTGDLTFSDKVAPPACKHQAEPYFTAIVDAAAFVTLDDFIGPHPPKEPLSALGPVLNLAHHG
ncbi:MAG TPA: hypothetical protein VGM14_06730 [Streptosporangiaceae bacterium]